MEKRKVKIKINAEGLRRALEYRLNDRFPNLKIKVTFSGGTYECHYDETADSQEVKAFEKWVAENVKIRQ